MTSFALIFSYYWIILFSITGYGLFFLRFFFPKSQKEIEIGYVGLYGIFFLLLISYYSNLLIAHNIIFNSIIIFIGLFNFLIFRQQIFLSKYFKIFILVFLLLIIAIYLVKNHDDFPYYHFLIHIY